MTSRRRGARVAETSQETTSEGGSGRLIPFVLRRRGRIQAAIDALAWMISLPVAAVLRYDFDLSELDAGRFVGWVAFTIALQLGLGLTEGLYIGRYSFGSFEEVAALTRTAVLTTVLVGVINYQFAEHLARSVPLIAGLLALIVMCGTRYGWRLLLERTTRPTVATATPALVFGAGAGAQQLVTSMLSDPDSPYVPLALLDDDPAKRRLRLRGVPVAGNRDDISRVAHAIEAQVLIIAIPSASAQLVRDLSEAAAKASLEVRVLPPVGELLGAPDVTDLRPVSVADLLGRHEIDTDLSSIADYLTGKRVLVTGAGGSIGSELCRQIYRFAPDTLIMLDRDESALHAVQLAIHGRALLDDDELVVADIRDAERLREVFHQHRPEVVFHAAALKHLTLLERHPEEGVKTNVLGTLNVLAAAMECGVGRFVNISTDKAADPTSMLGYTKRIAERLTAWAATQDDGTYLSVRFGNVLGSRGSVLTSFQAQIAAGGPVTVTDPEVTRFFMTVEEAVQLVIQAGAVGRDGEALVLDMGEPVRIADVARRLIDESGRRIEIVFTGLRPGEKLHEVLRASDEDDVRPMHPLISHVCVPVLHPKQIVETPVATLAAEASDLCTTVPATGSDRSS